MQRSKERSPTRACQYIKNCICQETLSSWKLHFIERQVKGSHGVLSPLAILITKTTSSLVPIRRNMLANPYRKNTSNRNTFPNRKNVPLQYLVPYFAACSLPPGGTRGAGVAARNATHKSRPPRLVPAPLRCWGAAAPRPSSNPPQPVLSHRDKAEECKSGGSRGDATDLTQPDGELEADGCRRAQAEGAVLGPAEPVVLCEDHG